MGYAKNDMMNVQERGYGHSDKIVCCASFEIGYIDSNDLLE